MQLISAIKLQRKFPVTHDWLTSLLPVVVACVENEFPCCTLRVTWSPDPKKLRNQLGRSNLFPEMDAMYNVVYSTGYDVYHVSWFTLRWAKDAFDFAFLPVSRISLTGIGPQCKRCSELICHLSRFSCKLPCFFGFQCEHNHTVCNSQCKVLLWIFVFS